MAFQMEMMEDVELHDDCVDAVEAFREKKVSFVMFHLRKKKKDGELEMKIKPDGDDSGGVGFNLEPFGEFCKRLPQDDARLCLVWFHPGRDRDYNIDEAVPIFVTWCPDIEAENKKELNDYVFDCMALNTNKYLIRKKGKYRLEVKASCLSELDPQEIEEQLEEGRPPTAVTGIFQEQDFGDL